MRRVKIRHISLQKLSHSLLLVLGCLLCLPLRAAVWDVVYPRPLVEGDKRDEYPVAVLRMALEQTGVKYQLRESSHSMEQSRSFSSLQSNREINVLWSMTDSSREAQLLPIRIPIFKGLIGLRLFLLRKERVGELQRVSTLANLRDFVMVQGKDWPDTKILQSNGFEVATAPYYPGLFDMLSQQQAELFPRSVAEIQTELVADNHDQTLAIDPYIGIYYPTAMYYFVNKKNVVLANILRSGLEMAIKNGEFEKLFMQVHAPLLKQAQLQKRKIFNLNNPILPQDTPLSRKELWYPIEFANAASN